RYVRASLSLRRSLLAKPIAECLQPVSVFESLQAVQPRRGGVGNRFGSGRAQRHISATVDAFGNPDYGGRAIAVGRVELWVLSRAARGVAVTLLEIEHQAQGRRPVEEICVAGILTLTIGAKRRAVSFGCDLEYRVRLIAVLPWRRGRVVFPHIGFSDALTDI